MSPMRVALVSVALLCTLAPALAQSPAWSESAFPESRFRAAFPGTPQKQVTSEDTKAGPTQLTIYSVEVADGAVMAGVCVLPGGTANGDPGAMLVGAQNGSIERVHGTLMRATEITISGPSGTYPGREFEMTLPNGFYGWQRVFLVKGWLYQLMCVRTDRNDEMFRTFVASFRLTD